MSLSEADRKAQIKDEKLFKVASQEVADLGSPANASDLEKRAEELLAKTKATKQIELANEYIKLRVKVLPKPAEKFEDIAIEALTGDSLRADKASEAANLYRRVMKAGAKGESFKTKAAEIYKYSDAFK